MRAIAKLGGYTPYRRAPEPGVKVLWLGLRRLDIAVGDADAAFWSDPGVRPRLITTETIDGQQAYRIELLRATAPPGLAPSIAFSTTTTIWVAVGNGLPLQVRLQVQPCGRQVRRRHS